MDNNIYVVIEWPDSQFLMEQDWFNECELINSDFGLDKYGSSAYFVPLNRYKSLSAEWDIEDREETDNDSNHS